MAKALARTIKSKRDYQAAKSAAETLREQTAKESAAERRLQALLHEIEKFDDGDEDLGDDDGDIAEDVGGFRRRWSDED